MVDERGTWANFNVSLTMAPHGRGADSGGRIFLAAAGPAWALLLLVTTVLLGAAKPLHRRFTERSP